MIFSREVKGTSPNKPKMSWWDYWIGHCWFTGWQSINHSFRNWGDLMTGNWKDYALMFYDDPFEECRDCFWSYLGDDDTLPKEFLEHLQEMVDRIDRLLGKSVTHGQIPSKSWLLPSSARPWNM